MYYEYTISQIKLDVFSQVEYKVSTEYLVSVKKGVFKYFCVEKVGSSLFAWLAESISSMFLHVYQNSLKILKIIIELECSLCSIYALLRWKLVIDMF